MNVGCIAKKIGMSRVFLDSGESVPVTYVSVEPHTVVRTKTDEKDGYKAVILGIHPSIKKTRKGKELKKYRRQKEWKVDSLDGLEQGKELKDDLFPEEGGKVTVTGVTKGKGFQGVVKRHGFHGGPGSHGSHHHREPGSVGMKEWPGRVLKGRKLPGQMGKKQCTLHHRPVVSCNREKGLIAIKGQIPGPNGAYVYITFESTDTQ
ncbi:50S ribosomal protein L3 [Candidatus Peregrinibacteria bacterium CG10_big_fil_rev_8_21_14_0_10_49_16]|nr:MAG: 50S ribosomal protein L3 [Candidatus Peregrinibacteria bacterium CG22_combo_CG10-13_8_21_14_all_49_11]PIR51823.1 MAG: 50S ribosomal protein L3 [Candidatus Peregrinibacteria bacterium CG10_big_fil_rev_8_21_14_0_10_49_16]